MIVERTQGRVFETNIAIAKDPVYINPKNNDASFEVSASATRWAPNQPARLVLSIADLRALADQVEHTAKQRKLPLTHVHLAVFVNDREGRKADGKAE